MGFDLDFTVSSIKDIKILMMANYKMSENYNFSDYCFPHGTVNGVSVAFYTTPEYRAEVRSKFKVRPESDIFIVTYPKSGTTWMQSILREMLYSNDTPEFSKMKLTNRIPWTDSPDEFLLDELDKWPSPRVFKCHHYTPEEMDDLFFKGSRKPKVIYVMRDPRDVSVSLYHHLRKLDNFSQFIQDATFDEFHKKVFRDKEVALYGLWEQHIDNWLSKRDEYDILVVKYEDLIEDAAREIERVAKFLDLELPFTTFQDIAVKTSFSSATKKDMFNDEGWTSSLLRKGVVGDWVNNFTDMEEADNMNRIAQDVYKKHGL